MVWLVRRWNGVIKVANYLYNGIELPQLPEWDKTTYPYACIFHTPNDDTISFYNEYAYLLVSTEPLRCRTKTFAGVSSRVMRITDAHSGLCYHCGWDIEDTHEVFDTFVRYPDFDIAADSGADLSSPYFPSKVIWANHDIIDNDDSSVYLAASDPIPVSTFTPDPISMTLGWLVGRRIAGQRGKKIEVPEEDKTPIAYLYNGVQLPDINTVWTDKETYPYAVMSNAAESVSIQNAIGLADQVYQLMVSSSPTAVKSSGSGYRYHVSDAVAKRYIVLVNSAELDALMTENNLTDEDLETALGVSRRGWLLMNEYDLYEAGFAIDSRPTNWANHDILNEDGSTYLAASDPVPVYE